MSKKKEYTIHSAYSVTISRETGCTRMILRPNFCVCILYRSCRSSPPLPIINSQQDTGRFYKPTVALQHAALLIGFTYVLNRICMVGKNDTVFEQLHATRLIVSHTEGHNVIVSGTQHLAGQARVETATHRNHLPCHCKNE